MNITKKIKGYTLQVTIDSEREVCVWVERGVFAASLSMLLLEGLLWSREGKPHKVAQVVQEQLDEFVHDTLSGVFFDVNR
jgi:hypothetical protein